MIEWAKKWGVPIEALQELAETDALSSDSPSISTEASAQALVRLKARKQGAHLWRNNVGVLPDVRGVPLRFGLANDSSKLNKVLKSSDLIGCRPLQVTQSHVGCVIGQFVAREVKAPGWKWSGAPREQAQLAFISLVNSLGGDASFTCGEF